ncbi:imelysin family protein [Salinimicrobium sediminilitoris]|uniref:imelysin family protein n=1 Tax=Salinimicrobium sediminilitoris TaxID=2876715 RepID=UPI001E59A57E|nr:imelysin family protein [Salinimicrobium sediminilitoris]MCC8358582.1 imelysin family protein [Salinimicrobium sediminilitoris]
MFKKLGFIFFVVVGVMSCNSDDGGKESPEGSFDRGAMLVNWADNIIIPSYEAFAETTEDLKGSVAVFNEDPSAENLESLRAAYEEAYLAYQTVAPFRIGKAESTNYHRFLNIYPASAATIQNNIESNSYNLELPSSVDEQGFPAVDFLINGLGATDAATVEFYTSNGNAAVYQQYLLDVATRIDALTDVVLNDWKTSYRDVFVNNTSSSSTGAVDIFTNDYIMYYEMLLRSGKIGIPAGAFTGNPAPETAEAYYSDGLSKELYLKALTTVQDFFNGKHFNGSGSGPSYKQYLDYLNTVKGGADLSILINEQFENIRELSSGLDPDLAEQVRTNNTLMLQVFDALQKNVILLKIDMLQALDISIDYVDSDGD